MTERSNKRPTVRASPRDAVRGTRILATLSDEVYCQSNTFDRAHLDFTLPDDLIASHPARKRDESRLLVVQRCDGSFRDARFPNLVDLLKPNDLLVLNDTKVLPARFSVQRATGGRLSALFLEEESPGIWKVLLDGARRVQTGEHLGACDYADERPAVEFEALENLGNGEWRLQALFERRPEQVLERIGVTPLPPYIQRRRGRRGPEVADRSRYQTVYAKQAGAVAAPTAGLHFTDELLQTIAQRGVEIAYVTLHVGAGTFKPIQVAKLERHVMHEEVYCVPQSTADAVAKCREREGRVVAVGTTCVRVLESVVDADGAIVAGNGRTGIFIYPPYRFRAVDSLLTNFHLPHSTLLALVMAFADVRTIQQAYAHAIAERYRFFSYGDAMLIL